MADIFISYARADRKKVRPFAEALEKRVWQVWWDLRIRSGSSFDRVIEKALAEARCVIVIWSQNSVESDWVRAEAGDGLDRGILISIAIEQDLRLPLRFRNVHTDLLIDLAVDRAPTVFNKIVEDIEALTGRPKPAPKSKPKVTETPQKSKISKSTTGPKLSTLFNNSISKDLFSTDSTKTFSEFNTGFTPPPSLKDLINVYEEPWTEKKPSLTSKIKNPIGMEFVLIPAGRFKMGGGISPEEVVRRYGGKAEWFKYEHPQHDVKINHPFCLQTTEVTVGQWRRFAKETGYKTQAETGGGAFVWEGSKWVKKEGTNWDNPQFSQDDRHPVTCVSWNDIQEFIQWLNRIDEKNGYRLPTEAEWEYACRADTTTEFSFGDDAQRLSEYAWYSDNSNNQTHAVAQKKANEWDLFDMHGNVWEWVADDWHDNYGKAPDDGRAWIDEPRGPSRVLRGGSCYYDAQRCRSASRDGDAPGFRGIVVGFRLARSVTLGS
jgi:formylglycine-generating enzyme required for sulfatase activity